MPNVIWTGTVYSTYEARKQNLNLYNAILTAIRDEYNQLWKTTNRNDDQS